MYCLALTANIGSIYVSFCEFWLKVKSNTFLLNAKDFIADKLNVSLRSLLNVNCVTSLPVNIGISVSCVLGAKLVAKAYFDQRDNLKTRVTVLLKVKSLVELWERACYKELENIDWSDNSHHKAAAFLPTWRHINHHSSIFEAEEATCHAGARGDSDTPFFGMMKTFSFSPSLDLRELLAWCVTGYASLSLPTDVAWVDRLSRIARYVVLRRLSVMEEARYYAALHRHVHFGPLRPGVSGVLDAHTVFPFLRSFGIFGSPSWLVPVPSRPRQPFLALPLSYFPVEAIFTFQAADEQTGWFPLVEVLLHRWKRTCERAVSFCSANALMPTDTKWTDCQECSLFLQYTVPLFHAQKDMIRRMREIFYHDKMYGGVSAYEGFGLDCVMYSSSSFIPGCKKRYRNAAKERSFKQALGLLYVAELFYSFTKVLIPSWRSMLTPLLFASLMGPSTTPSGDAALLPDETARMRPLRNLALYVVSLSFSSIIRATLRSHLAGVEQFVTSVLDQEIVSAIQSNLLRGDEAFIRRYVEQEDDDNACFSSDRQTESVRRLLEPRGSALLHSFKARIKLLNNIAACCIVALWRKEQRLLLFSIFYQRTTQVLLEWFYDRLGFSYPSAVHDVFEQLESSRLPERSPHGLALLLDVIAEKQGRDSGSFRAMRKQEVRFPFLSLLVTSAVWTHPPPEDAHSSWTLSQRELLYRRIATMRVVALLPPGIAPLTFSRLRGLQLDAACAWVYGIKYPYAYFFQYNKYATTGTERSQNNVYHEHLDPYERRMFERGNAPTRLPHRLDAYAVMARPFRFITRQLGIDVIAAQHTVFLLGAQREHSTVENFFVRDAQSFYGLYVISLNCLKFLGSFLFVVTVCIQGSSSANHSDYVMAPISVDECLKLKAHMELYTAMLDHQQFHTSLTQIQQLVQHVPCWIMDDAERSAALAACRRQWRTHLSDSGSPFQFDAATNLIVGGVTLHDAVRLHNVFFTYGQLHHYHPRHVEKEKGAAAHSAAPRGFKPVLAAVSLTLPCHCATSIIGDTGSGKSSIFKVLRRLYDPLVPVEIVPSPRDGRKKWWHSDKVLVEVLRLQLVTCPAAFPMQTTPLAVHVDSVTLCVEQRTCITFDHTPIGCLSPAYVRKWLTYLNQQTHTFSELSFRANIQYLSPFVTTDDIVRAVGMTNCLEFIQRHPLGLDAVCGDLSGGERQRLALARSLADISGRVHYERYCQTGVAGPATSCVAEGALLLDEPTSRLDAFNELQIVGALEKLVAVDKGREGNDVGHEMGDGTLSLMLVIISHKLSTLHFSKWMIVVRDGTVEMEGEPEFVLKGNSFARTVNRIQSE